MRTDRRIQRTERALGAALVELMLTDPFDDISVRRVLERAGVGRATFYAHYRNKQDLLLSEVERFCELLQAHFLERAAGSRRLAPVAELFHHVAEYHLFQQALARSGLRAAVYELVAAHLARTIEQRMPAPEPRAATPPVSRAATARALAAALMEMLRWWQERTVRPTAVEMDAHFHDLAWGGLPAALPPAPRAGAVTTLHLRA